MTLTEADVLAFHFSVARGLAPGEGAAIAGGASERTGAAGNLQAAALRLKNKTGAVQEEQGAALVVQGCEDTSTSASGNTSATVDAEKKVAKGNGKGRQSRESKKGNRKGEKKGEKKGAKGQRVSAVGGEAGGKAKSGKEGAALYSADAPPSPVPRPPPTAPRNGPPSSPSPASPAPVPNTKSASTPKQSPRTVRPQASPLTEIDVLRYNLSTPTPSPSSSSGTLAAGERLPRREVVAETPLSRKVFAHPLDSLGKRQNKGGVAGGFAEGVVGGAGGGVTGGVAAGVAGAVGMVRMSSTASEDEVDELASPMVVPAVTAVAVDEPTPSKKKGSRKTTEKKGKKRKRGAGVEGETTEHTAETEAVSVMEEGLKKKKKKREKEKETTEDKDRREEKEKKKDKAKTKEKGKEKAKGQGKEKDRTKGTEERAKAGNVLPMTPASAPTSAPTVKSAPFSALTPTTLPSNASHSSPVHGPSSNKKRRLTDIPVPAFPHHAVSSTTDLPHITATPGSSKRPKATPSAKQTPLTAESGSGSGSGTIDPARLFMYAAMGVVTPSPKAVKSAEKMKSAKKGPKWVTETPRA